MIHEITSFQYRGRRRREVELILDGSERLILSERVAANLAIGQRISAAELSDLKHKDQVQRYFLRALRLISIRPRSEFELRTYLRQKGLDEEILDDVIQELFDRNYVDDESFALEWIENRSSFRPKGRRILEAELRGKGISSEIIKEALHDYDEEEAARQVALKAARRFSHLDWENYQKKFLGYLSRRGFPYDLALSLVERSWNEQVGIDESEVGT